MKIDCPFCHIETELAMPLEGENLQEIMDRVEKMLVEAAMKRTYNHRRNAAKDLNIPEWALRHLARKHGLLTPKPPKK